MRTATSSPFMPSADAPLAGRTILQIVPELDAGGAERTAVDIAAGLADAGARALVATEGGRLVAELQAKGGIWVPFPARSKNPLRMALNTRRLRAVCLDEGVDLLHARSRAPAWTALAVARALRLPLATTYHGSYSSRSAAKALYNSVMARGDVVIANSHYTARLIGDAYPFARDRIRVIHRGTDLRAFSPAMVAPERVDRLRRSWGVDPDQRVALLAARLTAWKGQKLLIEAAKHMREGGVDGFVVVLAGDPQGRDGYRKELETLAAQLGLSDIVKIVGHCADMPAAFLAASVVAAPSTAAEAFGRSAVEAQAMGTPVVVSDIGAVPETVLAPPEVAASGRTGWRVPAGDAAALAQALTGALALGASARDALAGRARAHVEACFSLERMVGETLDVYGALLEGAKAHAPDRARAEFAKDQPRPRSLETRPK